MNLAKRILGWFGLPWCIKCGKRVKLVGWQGWDEQDIIACSNVDCGDYQSGGLLK